MRTLAKAASRSWAISLPALSSISCKRLYEMAGTKRCHYTLIHKAIKRLPDDLLEEAIKILA